jgi:hypothetical protein
LEANTLNILKSNLRDLKSFGVLMLALIFASTGVYAQSAGEKSPAKAKPNAIYKESTIERDVEENGEKGVRVLVSFTTYQMKNVNAQLGLRVYDGDDALMDKDKKFANADGEVIATRDIRPGFDSTEYKAFAIFLPYSQFDLEDGDYTLQLDIDLYYRDGTLIQHLGWEDFEYSQGAKEDEDGTKVSKIWVDYDVTRGGKRGMLVHVAFEVDGMKGVDAMLGIRIRKGGETYLESANAGFSNAEGEFEVTYSIKPGYDTAVYEDASVFIPFNEIVITRGTWDLELDVDLRYENGELIRHLAFHEFEFKRP